MSRSGYSEDCENLELYRQAVHRALTGIRGRAFLRELAEEMDKMPVKELIYGELINEHGCCAIGVVCKSRGLDVSTINSECPVSVGNAVGIAWSMAAEIEFMNDEMEYYGYGPEDTASGRWQRMREWVDKQLELPAAV